MLLFTPVLIASAELPEGSILSFDKTLIATLGIQLLNVAILAFILGWFFYKPVLKFMQSRTERIRAEVDAVRKDRDEALELKEKYEALVTGIEGEREEVLHQAYKRAVERSDQMLFDARRESELVVDRAMLQFEAEKKTQYEEIKQQIVELSVTLAGRIIEHNMDRELHDRLFDEAMAEWKES
ncbi:MAG: F0F1 ATP synthase subunit B [Clostridiales bacterium]|nr:F0F1 ATP synthase subunit B [Clostridiales bacterium]